MVGYIYNLSQELNSDFYILIFFIIKTINASINIEIHYSYPMYLFSKVVLGIGAVPLPT